MGKRLLVGLGLLGALAALVQWTSPRRPTRRGADTPRTFSGVGEGAPIELPEYCEESDVSRTAPTLAQWLWENSEELVFRSRYILRHPDESSEELREGLKLIMAFEGDFARGVELLEKAPDAHPDDYDMVLAATLFAARRALVGGEYDEAERWAQRASRGWPEHPGAAATRSLVALYRRDTRGRLAAAQEAFRLAPDEPAVSFALADLHDRRGEPSAAVDALKVYLASVPDDAYAQRMGARLAYSAGIMKEHTRMSEDGIVLHYPPSVSRATAGRALDHIREELVRAASWLGCERREELNVIVYADRSRMLGATCGPSWTGASFNGALHVPARTLGKKGVLSHEVLHAQMGSCAKRAPMWFNEGLAQFFAEDPTRERKRLTRLLVDNGTWIPFSSLEGSISEIGESQDARLAYFQSLVLIEMLLAQEGPEVLPRAIRLLNEKEPVADLLAALSDPVIDGPALLRYLRAERGK